MPTYKYVYVGLLLHIARLAQKLNEKIYNININAMKYF